MTTVKHALSVSLYEGIIFLSYFKEKRIKKCQRKQKWETYETKAEAKRRKKEIEYKKEMGSFVVRKCKTLDELITEYVALYGNLYIHEAKISDELYEESWIATDEEVHRFLSKYLWKLSLNDVII